ncbi:methyltransferase dimerization domain-containing protein [Amycolatopsis sp. A133]|uniref:methyltransferase family protein n=1 Tax=Amycolatopsis sp. A133 TaxID=3064472 RepID=UPI0027E5EC3D|nr:methyltransferase dimerization domain-containing protein [Amycolatopsis sp. A133]MDQ7804514.1 methyltransferase dimerization domain-containing protein [Amycolatopsis sp. A133]
MTPTPATPEPIVETAVGYMRSQQLFAANRIGLFPALAAGPLGAGELADRTGKPEQTVRILADTLAALGLLSRVDGRYALTPDIAEYLGGGGLDLAPFLTFLETISYPHWLQFAHTTDTGEPGDLDLDGDRWDRFLGGVMVYNALHARMLARIFDFGGFKNLLDLGGLSAEFAVQALHANDVLRATFVYDPRSVEPVTAAVAEFADRATVVGAPTPDAEPAGEFDLVMVNHVVHRFSVDENRAILRHARAAAAPGARLLLLDFFLDDDASPRALDALHAGEYLVIDGTVVHPERDVRGWLADAGWRPVDRLTLPGSPRVLVAEAV